MIEVSTSACTACQFESGPLDNVQGRYPTLALAGSYARLRLCGEVGYNRPPLAMPEHRITAEQVRHVAKLARLAMSDDELSRFGAQLESILDYVATIGRADVSGVEPLAHAVNLTNVFREDEPGPTLPLDKVLQNAPETDGPFFKVPKILGGDEDSAG